jgi:TatD DNase family protein
MIATLEDEMGKGAFKAVLHCFSSGQRLAEAGVALGLYVSFSGILTYKKSDELRSIALAVPLAHLLVETDAPYLAPQSHRGKRNEPSFVTETHATLAEVKGVSTDELARYTTDNFFRLFSKARRPLQEQSAA